MMDQLTQHALKFRGLVLLLLATVVGFGIMQYRDLDVEAFPDISPIMVPIFTEADGMAPEEVERFITYPIETSMNGLPSVTRIQSTSAFGMSVIYVYFTDDTDIYFARQLVAERLSASMADLPELHEPPALGPISTGLGQIFLYYLELEEGADTDGLDALTYLRDINDWVVKRQLQTVQGVTEILSAGGHVLQYQIRLLPDRLLQYDLSIEDVISTVQQNNRNVGGNYLTLGQEEYLLRGIGLLGTIEEIEQLPLKSMQGSPLRIKDVAEVSLGQELRRGVVTLGNGDEVVSGIVMKLYGANASNVIEDLYEKVDELQAGLPAGVHLKPYYEQADLVGNATRTVNLALLQGIILVLLILFAFLGSFRTALIVAMSMPFSALIAFIGMPLLGISANLMSLGGIAIAMGMLVDGSIVVTENIHRMLGLPNPENKPLQQLILSATHEVGRPIAFAIFIVIIVFLPILSLDAVEGKMFKPLAYTVMLALAGSLVFALAIAPVLSIYLLKQKESKESKLLQLIHHGYERLLTQVLQLKAAVVVVMILLIGCAGWGLKHLGTEFIPVLEEGSMMVSVSMAPSISLEQSTLVSKDITRKLQSLDGVKEIVSRIGRPEAGGHPHPVNTAEIHVELLPGADKKMLLKNMRAQLATVPGIQVNIAQPIQHQFDELLSGVKAQLAIKVFGEDLNELRESANEIEHAIKDIPGLVDLSVEQSFGQPQVKVILNREALARYGVQGDTVLDLVEIAAGGQVIDDLYRNTRRYGIHVRYDLSSRDRVETLKKILLRSDSGTLLRLEEVADFEQVEGPLQINRENNQRRWIVKGNIRDRDLGSVVADIQQTIKEQVALPTGVFVEYGGQFEQQQNAMKRLAFIVPLVILSIFVLLWMAFGQLRHAVMILLNVPMALIGGVFGLWVTGQYLSVPASIGFIALFGIAMQDAMVLLTDFNDLRREGQPLKEAVIHGALIRFRPVIMTTLTTLLGLTPLLLSTGSGAEVQRPLAAVVVFGLATSTLLTLFVLPTVYNWVEGRCTTKI
ncbi:CusA/CzcA family heavy metal efflux RND transporter [Kiritimatiellota bacterium B12222]|nr:CusA/CzcA family heavy metal efflux RND transporter [Kiritimatiellota bacterium B12222]